MSEARLTRRSFMKIGAAAGGGLLVTVTLPGAGWRFAGLSQPDVPGAPESYPLNAFVEVGLDGSVIIYAPCPELGQGVRTSLPMIVAEELGVEWDAVTYRQAPADERFGSMTVGGSDSVSDYWAPLRAAGALTRELLKEAAARRWRVEASTLRVRSGRVVDDAHGRSAVFGELAAAAVELEMPEDAPLESPEEFQLLGRPTPVVDAPDIVTGRAIYGLDFTVPDMLYAVVERSSVHGGRVAGFEAGPALDVPGVSRVIEVQPWDGNGRFYGSVRSGVAVVAESTWAALQGRSSLRVRWERGGYGEESSERIRERMRNALDSPAASVLREEGDFSTAIARAARRLTAEYELPPLAHVPMEPMNFTADVGPDGCRVWGPTQTPRALRRALSEALGLPLELVEVRPTLAGGGFGRRLAYDYGVEAALISRDVGRPVKVVWMREDDLRHDYYRTPSHHRLEAGLDSRGDVVAWLHHVVSAPLLHHTLAPGEDRDRIPAAIYDIEGASDIAYDIPDLRIEYTPVDIGLQMGSWRSVAHSFNVFAVNSFIDEIAQSIGVDPVQLQLRMLGRPRVAEIAVALPGRRGSPRPDTGLLRRVLDTVVRESGWGSPMPPGHGRGVALSHYKRTYAAHVAEVSVDEAEGVRVRRVVVAMDCGRVVNPSGAAAQVEGAVMDAVASALKWGVTISEGSVDQSNFHDYPLLTIGEAPDVEVHLLPSQREPSGMGEPPYPSAVPAITNAIFAASGRRIRRLPIGSTEPEAGNGS